MFQARFKVMIQAFVIIIFFMNSLQAQTKPKYSSVLWEITGKGMKKPSYLFGTMHLSEKLVYNLSDSFYHAIKQTDGVALELNIEQWQKALVNSDLDFSRLNSFYSGYNTDYITKNTMEEFKVVDDIKTALKYEPRSINVLLYRSGASNTELEENTYLDLHIFQTGKKFNKKIYGLENYYESQMIEIESMIQKQIEKKKKQDDGTEEEEEEPDYAMQLKLYEGLKNAYKQGNLDVIDSIYTHWSSGKGHIDSVMFKRNVIHANSIDTIIKNHSLFAAVGVAHLPGKNGVIELLRKKGYKLRPVKMDEREAAFQKELDTMLAPTVYTQEQSNDGLFSYQSPGMVLNENNSFLHSLNFITDVGNGVYYLVMRIRATEMTHSYSSDRKLQILDSLLYENVPGTIVSKNKINQDGYQGFEILSKLKSGAHQRYKIFATPYEWIVFKASGNNEQTLKSSDKFFSSIHFNPISEKEVLFEPENGGFAMKLPTAPIKTFSKDAADGLPEWKYAAFDSKSDIKYYIIHKNIYSFKFIEPDTLAAALLSSSVSELETVSEKMATNNLKLQGRDVVENVFKLKDGKFLTTRYFVSGPHYYVVAATSPKMLSEKELGMFNSFEIKPFTYDNINWYMDTFLNVKVKSPLLLSVDDSVRRMFFMVQDYKDRIDESEYMNYEKIMGTSRVKANFISYKTGEVITLTREKYSKYFELTDSAKSTSEMIIIDSSLVISKQLKSTMPDGTLRLELEYNDTGSQRKIYRLLLLNGNEAFEAFTCYDSLLGKSNFVNDFYSSLSFLNVPDGKSIFSHKLPEILNDLKSKDTTVSNTANEALNFYQFKEADLGEIQDLLKNQKLKNYSKSRDHLISQLGLIQYKDANNKDNVADILKTMYAQANDTAVLQNVILTALANLDTKKSVNYFKELILEDPPFFNDEDEYENLMNAFYGDSVKNAKELFPDLMALANITEYKNSVYYLLSHLYEEKKIDPSFYEPYLAQILFESNIAFKKEKGAIQSQIEYRKENAKSYNEYSSKQAESSGFSSQISNDFSLDNYVLESTIELLMPFYNSKPNVKTYLNKLLNSNYKSIQWAVVSQMIKSKYAVPDSMVQKINKDSAWLMYAYDDLSSGKIVDGLKYFNFKNLDQYAQYYYKERLYNKLSFIEKNENLKEHSTSYIYSMKDKQQQEKYMVVDYIKNKNGFFELDDYDMIEFKEKDKKSKDAVMAEILKRIYFNKYDSGKEYFGEDDEVAGPAEIEAAAEY